MNLLYAILAFAGPGLFGFLMGRATGFLSPAEGALLILVPSGLAWILWGPLCMAVNRWSFRVTTEICLKTMAAGSLWLALASAGFVLGGQGSWALFSLFCAHGLMWALFVRLGKTQGKSTLRLSLLWIFGLDGGAALVGGIIPCL